MRGLRESFQVLESCTPLSGDAHVLQVQRSVHRRVGAAKGTLTVAVGHGAEGACWSRRLVLASSSCEPGTGSCPVTDSLVLALMEPAPAGCK